MTQANTNNNTRRRDFLALTAAVATAAMAARPALASQPDDSALLALEEQIFEQWRQARSLDDEIIRLAAIWQAENNRLYWAYRTDVGDCLLNQKQRWDLVSSMPECIEHDRLCGIQETHMAKMDTLIKEMQALPAHTPEGRRAKAQVLLACVMGKDWTKVDEETSYLILQARNLLCEFIGGEPGATLRDQFA